MAVRDWIAGFLDRHKARYDPRDWPASEASEEMKAYVQTWVTHFNLKEVSEKEADEASRRLACNPPNFRREHIPMVVQSIEQLRAERNPKAAAAGGTREAAKDASRGCEFCGGEGLAIVFHPFPSEEDHVSPTSAAYCVCEHGRFIKRNHAETDRGLLRRIPDLDHVLNRASVYLVNPPEFHRIEGLEAATPSFPGAPKKESISDALRFIVSMLAVRPTPLSKMLSGAKEFRISYRALLEAADKLEVIKMTVDGEETWDIAQGINR